MPALLDDDIFSCERNVLNVSDVSNVSKVSNVSNTSIFKSHFCFVYNIEGSGSGSWTAQNNQLHSVADATGTDETLSVSYISNTQSLSVAMGSEQTKLSLPLENFSGNVGLEVSSSTVPTSAPAQPATCVFKEFVYQKIIPPVNLTYSYNSMNQLIAINGSESATFVYDDLGNMTSQNWTKEGITQTTTFAYDALNRQTQSGDQSSTYYGASGLRKTGLVNGIETTFIHDGNTCLSSISNAGGAGANGTTNYFVPGSAPLWEASGAGANGGGAITTYGMERGHVTAMVGSGGVATRFNYDAFGNMTAKTFGSTTVDKSSSGPRYNGYYLDAAQNHYATGYRPYRPDIGRFTSLDPAGSPNGPNRYNYCSSEPVNRRDASGKFWEFTINDDYQMEARWNDESEYGDPQKPPMADGPSLEEIEAAENFFEAGGDPSGHGTFSAIHYDMVGAFASKNTIGDVGVRGMGEFPLVSLGGNYFIPKSNNTLPGGSLDLNDLEEGGFSAFYISELNGFVRTTGQYGAGGISPFVGQFNLCLSVYGYDAQSSVGACALAKYAASPAGRTKSLLIAGGALLTYKFFKGGYAKAVGEFAARMGKRFVKGAEAVEERAVAAEGRAAGMTAYQMGHAEESMRDGIDRSVRSGKLQPPRPPRHHVFPQEHEAWFKARGVNIDGYTMPLDQGTHSALHYGEGGGWWNKEIMTKLLKEEARQGRQLLKKEILAIGNQMRRKAILSHIKVIPYKD